MKEEIFMSTMIIFFLFNIFVAFVNPNVSSPLNMNLSGILITATTIILAGGITVFGSGLSESALKIVFSILILFNVLFQVNIYGFTIGIGLATTVINVFSVSDMMGIGYLIASTLSMIAFISGMMIVVDSG